MLGPSLSRPFLNYTCISNHGAGERGLKSETKAVIVASIVVIIAISFGAYYYYQVTNRRAINDVLFEQYKELQTGTAKSTAQSVGRSLELTMAGLSGLAATEPFQQGNFTSSEAGALLKQHFGRLGTVMDTLEIVDSSGTVVQQAGAQGIPDRTGQDLSASHYVQQVRFTRQPLYSEAQLGTDGSYRIFVNYPVINRETGNYLGMLSAGATAVSFFGQFGNTDDPDSGYIGVMDRRGTLLITPFEGLAGVGIFDDRIGEALSPDSLAKIRLHAAKLLAGNSTSLLLGTGSDERLVVGQPVVADGNPAYYVFTVNPTSTFYDAVEGLLFAESVNNFVLLASATGALIVLAIVIIWWNAALEVKVRDRTRRLERAVEQLKVSGRLQKDFINIAAHEIRTPITPILMTADNVEPQNPASDVVLTRPQYDIIVRNTKRLRQLANDILDVSKMENNTLALRMERLDLGLLVADAVADVRSMAEANGNEIKLEIRQKLSVEADPARIRQVVANLVSNAGKFTEQGTITVTMDRAGDQAMVQVKDSGIGIDPEIMPRLFTKFAAKSDKGIGLGLYICKWIIDAHGGRIAADNNAGEKGSTFAFTLRLAR
ncbi:MAG: sensor histidine kinase [Nitrososphaera sp.]